MTMQMPASQLAHWSPRQAGLSRARFGSATDSFGGAARVGPRDLVLIVEDDRVVAEMYRVALTRGGYEVEVAEDGLAGLQKASMKPPDFVFLDIRMPRMNGLETLRRLRSSPSTHATPVIMLSNYDDAGQISASMELGAKQYIVKTTVLPGDLPKIVSQWLGRGPE